MRIILIWFLLLTTTLFSQNVCISEFNGRYYFSRGLTIVSSDGTYTTLLTLDLRKNYDFIEVVGINVQTFGMCEMVESNELILEFADGRRIIKDSKNEYKLINDWFYLNEVEVVKLATTKLTRIRFMDGACYDMVEKILCGDEQTYFIDVLNQVKDLNIGR
jgi:hypothetical protein